MKTTSHWRQYVQHGITMDNKFFICENINIFGYLGAWGWGGGGFNNQTGPILVHIYPLFNNNLHVKYRKHYDKILFFLAHVGPVHKIQGEQGHRNISKCRPHHSGDICTTRGNNLKTSFSYTSQNVKQYVYFGLFWGPWGGGQCSDCAYLAFQLSSHPYLCTCQIRKQSDKKSLLKKKYFFSYLGGPGGPLRLTQVNEISGQ